MKEKKILYIMHVPWAWIKQRPHFLAEHLSENFDVKVFYKRPLKVSKNNLVNAKNEEIPISSFFVFPFKRIPVLKKITFLNRINNLIVKLQMPKIDEFDFVWVTSWSMYNLIEDFLPSKTKLIYDCMDDDLEFPNIKNNNGILKEATETEKKLVKRADIMFCSSDYLKNKIIERTNVIRDIIIVNNAVCISNHNNDLRNKSQEIFDKLSILDNVFMYVGAISEWFDFEIILYVLENEPLVNFVLLGPADIEIPFHKRLHHMGTVDRVDIFRLMESTKGLIMPFKLNELIKSVNPVKLYEYIYMSKPIIATRYSETELFENYIYLYNGKIEFHSIIKGVLEGALLVKKNSPINKAFALNNTWEVRYKTILPYLIKESIIN